MFRKLKKFFLAFFLEYAIVLEEQAYHVYDMIEREAESSELKFLARTLRGEELKQLLQLREIQKYSYIGQHCTEITNLDKLVKVVEQKPAVKESLKAIELLHAANKREEKATRFCHSVKKRFPHSLLGDVFASIAKEGEKHARLISAFLGGQG